MKPITSCEFYARVERERLPGESYLVAVRRIVIEDFVAAYGSETAAAAVMGCTQQAISGTLAQATRRVVQVNLGAIIKRGGRPGSMWSQRRRESHELRKQA
jgi:hypothetical protein